VGTVEYKLTVRILAVDTTTARGSLAVVTEGEVLAEARSTTPAGHSTWLLAEVEAALGRLSLAPGDLDGFAVATGPGSFTGLRVGLSSVQGLALATGLPCVGGATLDLLAASAGHAPTVVALVDAVRGEVFAGIYDGQGRLQGERRATRVEDLADELRGEVAFVGDGAQRYRDDLERLFPKARFPEVELFLAPALGRWGIARLAAGEGGPPGDLRPLYLRGAHIRTPRA